MHQAEKAARLRCKPGDVVTVVASTYPELVGAIAFVQGRRGDGQWNVLLEKATLGVAAHSGRQVVTREFSFDDGSLDPIGNVHTLLRAELSLLLDDRRLPSAGSAVD